MTDNYKIDSLPERFQKKINIDRESGCWLWSSAVDSRGYGRVSYQGKNRKAHRVVYETLTAKPLKKRMTLDHLCRVRNCVNPSHLEATSLKVNILRGISPSAVNSRKAKCPNGHDYEYKWGHRFCMTCRRDYMSTYKPGRSIRNNKDQKNA